MGHQGKVQLTYVIVAPADQVAEGERLFASHARWMAGSHHREGDRALLTYNVSSAPELSNPMDTSSEPTGNTCFVLHEIYETEAGVADHFQQASGWSDFGALVEWLGNCRLYGTPVSSVTNSLW
jgi:hypothetical protein